MNDSLGWLLAFVAAASVSGCSCNSTKGSEDGGRDGGRDVPAAEASAEAGKDAPAEVAPDAPADVGSDAPADVGGDAPADATPDVADASPEVHPACMTIPVTATRTVHLRITADNECDVYVNGALTGTTTSWPSPVTMDVSLFIHPGRVNVISVEGRNVSSQGGADRGIIGTLEDLSDGGSKAVIVTDATWRSAKTAPTGWRELAFDDSTWDMATVVGANGDAPWGALLGSSTAKWLWSAPIPDSTSDKPNAETGYFRKRFYFSVDGEVTATPGCPAVVPEG